MNTGGVKGHVGVCRSEKHQFKYLPFIPLNKGPQTFHYKATPSYYSLSAAFFNCPQEECETFPEQAVYKNYFL